ncbi:DUF4400 domain-containing protein [Parasulfuritortus cantonensis]|uniref:DUF4400 domain-containing protein n=1 Tax=Parasulfuritortus cantonensis TaxID=2528202 RepID=A0A4R1BR30_9PROT|nr:DUF4400 domain-containing protein [Parasulfuritortus cantonensis]TCJ20184.1 DUF4400 domain-containing protein [Parasulfuritortus cantonensis]
MPGDGATIDIGVTKAVTAPFKIVAFLAIAFFVLVVGRLAIDMWALADHQDLLEAPESIMKRELARAAVSPDFMGPTLDRAVAWADFITEWFYRKPGLIQHLDDDQIGETERAVRRGVRSLDFAVSRALVGSQVVAIRAAILVSYLPWAGFLYALSLVDGIVQRWLRKYGGGRESSTLYHRAKYLQVILLTVATAAYLWWPGDIDATIIALVAPACAILVRIQAEFYKKYI